MCSSICTYAIIKEEVMNVRGSEQDPGSWPVGGGVEMTEVQHFCMKFFIKLKRNYRKTWRREEQQACAESVLLKGVE